MHGESALETVSALKIPSSHNRKSSDFLTRVQYGLDLDMASLDVLSRNGARTYVFHRVQLWKGCPSLITRHFYAAGLDQVYTMEYYQVTKMKAQVMFLYVLAV